MGISYLRYMQVSFTAEEGAHLPGIELTSDFNKVEFLTKLGQDADGMRAIIQVEYDDPEALKKDQGAYKLIKVLEQTKNSALCEIVATGPLTIAFEAVEHAWWVPPTYIHPNGMLMTIRGTKEALTLARNSLSAIVGDAFKLKLGGESLYNPEFINLLPKRQRLVLDKAIELGYYDRPRGCTQRDIAGSLDIKQATVSEHLQSAEATIIHAFTTEV
jgi:predicted DNA binding protein